MKSMKYVSAVLIAAALAGCDGGTGSDSGRLTIRLHDAPGDLDKAFVEIERLYLVGGNDSTLVLQAPTGFIDLLDLTNGRFHELVRGLVVPAGSYNQLRVVVGDAYIRTEDGRYYAKEGTTIPGGVTPTGTLRCPSCSSSGFKINFPSGGLTIGEGETILSLDFDVNQSFGHQAGNSGAWVMHPVVHVTNVSLGRTIGGTVALAAGVTLPTTCGNTAVSLTQFVPTATGAGGTFTTATVASSATPPTYSYAMPSVPIGAYTMGHQAEVTFTGSTQKLTFAATPSVGSVDLATGNATVNYTVTGATCAG